tara:strand:+ start:59 stop:280 length:222 start_codon:yes stop_codon:yes gene_type:complete
MAELVITHFVFVAVVLLVITAIHLMGRAARDPKCEDYYGLTSNYGRAAWCSCGLAFFIIIAAIYIAVRAITAQ